MPIYEYQCPTCKERFEKLVRAGAPGEVACPTCGAASARRLVSTFAARIGAGSLGAFAASGGSCAPTGGG